SAVHVRAGTADRLIHDSAFLIKRQRECPNVVAGAILPAVEAPSFGSGFAIARDGMKFPKLLTRARIVGVRIADFTGARLELRSNVALAGAIEIRARQNDVLINGGSAVVRHLQLDLAVVAETG